MFRLWRGRGRREREERELEEEVRGYAELLRAEGMDARAAAVALGGAEQVKEAVRAGRRGASLEALGRDIRYGARRLRQRPGYALAVIAVLGVGIGLTTALFGAVNALILRPLPFPQAQQLVTLQVSNYSVAGDQLNQPMKPGLRQIFSGYAGYQAAVVNIAAGGPPARMRIAAVTADFFPMLGVGLERGRGFATGDFFYPKGYTPLQPAAPVAVVLSDALWRTRYGAARNILGRRLHWGGVSYRVVGVAPAGFAFPQKAQAWIAYRSAPIGGLDGSVPTIVGRLRPGLSFAVAEARMADWVKRHRDSNAIDPPFLIPLRQQLLGGRRGLLLLLWAASGLVLLLAGAGAVGLGAGQTWARRRELALRLAIGASTARVRRQLLTEGVLLGLAGGAVGWMVALLAGHVLGQLWTPAPVGVDLGLGGAAAAMAFGLALASGVAVGLTGNRRHWGWDSEGYGRGAGPVRTHGGEWLTAVQLTLAVILLTATAALGRSWMALTRVPAGVNPQQALAMEVSLPNQNTMVGAVPNEFQHEFGAHPERATVAERARLAQAEAASAHIRGIGASMRQRVEALPGVQSAGLLSYLPFEEQHLNELGVSKPGPGSGGRPDMVEAYALQSGPGALRALGMTFVSGHGFGAGDAPGCETILSASLMQALGYRSMPASVTVFPHKSCRPVGVANDVRLDGLRQKPTPSYYTRLNGEYTDASPVLIVRAQAGMAPLALLPEIRQALEQMAPGAAVSHVSTLDALLSQTHAHLNEATSLFGLFALLAAAIAGLSVFALALQTAIARTQEIGVRMALGAAPDGIRRWMLGRHLGMAIAALAVAFPLAWLLERALGQWLYDVTPGSGLSYALAAVALGVVVLAAAWWPAQRAAQVAPMEALRHE